MFRYAAASHCWRAMPIGLADWAWQRRGRMLIQRAACAVPAYGQLLRIFSGRPAGPVPAFADMPALETCRRSYLEVFPVESRCRRGWQKQAVAFDPPADENWPRGRDERRTLREHLVGLLSGWFDATRRRTLLVLALPDVGWSGRRRIGQALQEALDLGQVYGSLVDGDRAGRTVSRLAGFDQCVVLTHPGAVTPADWLAGMKGRCGVVLFGPRSAGAMANLPDKIPSASVLGADEVVPLIAVETPLSRLVHRACRAEPRLAARLRVDGFSSFAAYQPLPRGPWLEEQGGQLLVTSWGACPLIRYRLGCRGRIIPFRQVCDLLRQERILSARQIRRLTRIESTCWKLPLVIRAGR